MHRLSILVIRLYPYDFRSAFAAEMISILERRPVRSRELFAILRPLICEWIAKITTDKYTRARALPDLRMMRPPGISKEEWFAWASVTSPSR